MELGTSWLNGKYLDGGEINTGLPYVAFGEDYFAQGDEADKVINEIHAIWLNSNITQAQAVAHWRNIYSV